ncbi:MAG: hypothetical protein IPM45_00820 [Acidimicrobiales bacterium]|nr:hypothetical protein [Acidimicrobiales bacterium]
MRRGLLITLGVVALGLLLAEGAARVLAPYLPEPPLWHDRATAVKASQMDELASGGGCVPVVFVGNSMTRDALVPEVFTAADPARRPAYNAALDAATPALLERWVTDQVVPRLHPDTVVIGLSSFDLNDNASIGRAALAGYEEAPQSRSDVWGRLQAPFLRWSDLVRYRTELRDPGVVWGALGRLRRQQREPRDGPEGIPGILGPLGEGLSRRDQTYTGSPGVQQFVRSELLNDFAVGGRQVRALHRTVTTLQDEGVQVVLLLLPVTDDYVALHPEGSADHDAFVAAVEQVGRETGATVVDGREVVRDPTSFADTHHLNAQGADHLSSVIPGLLPDPPRPVACEP